MYGERFPFCILQNGGNEYAGKRRNEPKCDHRPRGHPGQRDRKDHAGKGYIGAPRGGPERERGRRGERAGPDAEADRAGRAEHLDDALGKEQRRHAEVRGRSPQAHGQDR